MPEHMDGGSDRLTPRYDPLRQETSVEVALESEIQLDVHRRDGSVSSQRVRSLRFNLIDQTADTSDED